MNDEPRGTGWTALKVVGLIFALFGMVGFGLCGLLGVAVGDGDSTVLGLGILGLLLAGGCLWGAIAIIRAGIRSRRPRA